MMDEVHPLAAFVRLSRPHFLVGGALMFAVGVADGRRPADGLDWAGVVWGQLLVTAAQITAHYVNEYADVEPDRRVVHRTAFSGGSGVLVAGALAPRVALRSARVSSVVAVAATGVLAATSWWLGLLGLVSLTVSWTYSMPPVRLLGRGVGELATSLVVAGAVPMIGSWSQGAAPSPALWWSIAVLVPLHLAMMLTFELPDLAADAGSGKRVLAVRVGRRWTLALGGVALAVAYGGAVAGGVAGAIGSVPGAVATAVAVARNRHGWSTLAAVAMFVGAGIGVLVELA